MKKMKRTLWLVPMLMAALAAAGCGGSRSSAKNDMAAQGTYAAETTAAAAYDSDVSYDGGEYEAGAPGEKSENTSAGLTGAGEVEPLPVSNRKLIRNINMQVEADDFDSLIAALNAKVKELGGYLEESRIDGNSRSDASIPKYAHMLVRIPSDKLDGFVSSVEKEGNVLSKVETTTDVTLHYSDIESRKKSLEIEQGRIWALLEKADSLDAVIALEQRLSDIRYELESMGSQLKLYDNQVEYSTVMLDINEVKVYTPVKPETVGERISRGFTRNLKAVETAATDFVIGLLAASPIWIPIALIVGLVLFIGYWRNKKRILYVSRTLRDLPVIGKEKKDEEMEPGRGYEEGEDSSENEKK